MPAGKTPSKHSRNRRSSFAIRALLCAVAVPLWLSPGRALGTVPDPTSHQPVLCSVELRSPGPSDRTSSFLPKLELESLIEMPVGLAPHPAAIRRTLANFHATGWFRDIGWWTRPDPNDPQCVQGALILDPHPRVRDITFSDDPPLSERRLRRALRQKENTVLEPRQIRESEAALVELFHREGYFEARIRSEIRADKPPWNDLTFHLDSGPRASIAKVLFEGDTGPFDAVDLHPALRSTVGRAFDHERSEEDVERLRRFLVKRGFYQAQVETPRRIYDPDTDTVTLSFPLQTGPAFELEILGAQERRLKRRGFLPFLEDRPFDDVLLAQTCARLRRDYQKKGHFHADVDCHVDPDTENPRAVSLSLDPGPVYKVASVRFPGAERVSEQKLRTLVSTGPGTWWSPRSGHLIGEELDGDLERVRSYYLLEGFRQAQVGPARILEVGDQLHVDIPIEEGPRRQVVSVEVQGIEGLSEPSLVDRLPLRAGSGYHPLLLEDAVNLIRTLCEEEGHASAVVEPRLDWDPNGLLVDVDLIVDLGPKRVLDRLVLRGLQHTHPELVRRFAGLETGDVLSRRRLLKAERDLYRLGIFSEVDVDLAPSVDLSSQRDVRIRLREGRRWRLAYGVSYHSDDGIGGLFGLTRSNLRGRGERLQLDLRASANDSRLRLIYDQPSLGPWRLPVTYTLFNRFELRESYEVHETGTRVSLTRDLDRLRLGLVYDYRFVELSEDVLDPTAVEREDSEVEIASLAPNLFIDRRNDPVNPGIGWSTALQLEYAFPMLTAETELLKLFWQQTHYQPLGQWGTLAASFRLGLIEPLSTPVDPDPIVPIDLASSRVPISERFFAGGRTTHRAYERDRLGILGESLHISEDGRLLEAGGNGLVLLNLDYRFPISGPVEGVSFLDLGNVWADWSDIDLGDLRPGFGLGVRYSSPVGPIRLEIGWKLDAQPFEDNSPVFFLSFGNPF